MPKWDGVQEHIGEIAALKKQDLRESAQETLEKVYRYVLPIMQKRRYRVHKLNEFLPRNPNLLGINVNHGQRISLRLRYHHNPKEFLPFESVLGTMLHELCHNTYGPHDNNFFALLDELTKEMEDMMARGFTGDPFVGAGDRLMSAPRSNLPNRISAVSPTTAAGPGSVLGGLVGSGQAGSRLGPLNAIAGRGAINRRKTSRRGGRGRKLGGLGTRPPRPGRESLRQLALEAAERRRLADASCRTAKRLEDLAPDGVEDDVVEITAEEFASRAKAGSRATPPRTLVLTPSPKPTDPPTAQLTRSSTNALSPIAHSSTQGPESTTERLIVPTPATSKSSPASRIGSPGSEADSRDQVDVIYILDDEG